jgi:hypothetical protein
MQNVASYIVISSLNQSLETVFVHTLKAFLIYCVVQLRTVIYCCFIRTRINA